MKKQHQDDSIRITVEEDVTGGDMVGITISQRARLDGKLLGSWGIGGVKLRRENLPKLYKLLGEFLAEGAS